VEKIKKAFKAFLLIILIGWLAYPIRKFT